MSATTALGTRTQPLLAAGHSNIQTRGKPCRPIILRNTQCVPTATTHAYCWRMHHHRNRADTASDCCSGREAETSCTATPMVCLVNTSSPTIRKNYSNRTTRPEQGNMHVWHCVMPQGYSGAWQGTSTGCLGALTVVASTHASTTQLPHASCVQS